MNKKFLVALVLIVAIGIVAVWFLKDDKEETNTAYDYDLSEYVEVGEYKGLPYAQSEAEVSDEDVQAEINNRLNYLATTETVTEGIVEDGDTINVAYVGTIDGVAFEGGSTASSDITIGTTNFIDGFIEGLIGKNIGETVTLNLRFPDEYHSEDLAGKDCVFEVTINSKKVTSVPELNEEFVQSNSEYETVEEYTQAIKDEILEGRQNQIDASIKNELWSYILKNSTALKYPADEMTKAGEKANALEAQYMQEAASYGMEWEKYLNDFMGTDVEGFEQMKEEYAQSIVLGNMVMYYICEKEGVTFSQDEYEAELEKILSESGYTEDTFEQYFGQTIEEYAEENDWYSSLMLDKLLVKIKDMGTQVSEEEYAQILEERSVAESESDESETEPETETGE